MKQEHREKRHFSILVPGNEIPYWFSYRKEVSNNHSCEIDIDVPADLDGEISKIVFSAVFDAYYYDISSISVYVISGGVEIYRGKESLRTGTWDCVWLHFYVLEPCKLKEFNGHLRVKFVYKTGRLDVDQNLKPMKSCGVHLVRRCEEKAKDSIGGIHEVTKRPRDDDDDDDDDDKFESSLYPPQKKRHSSTLGIRISDTEAEDVLVRFLLP